MNDIIKLLTYYGPLVVITAIFLWRVVAAEKRHAEETKAFTEISASFANVLSNHLHDESEALRDLTKAIERLCYMVDANRDYQVKG